MYQAQRAKIGKTGIIGNCQDMYGNIVPCRDRTTPTSQQTPAINPKVTTNQGGVQINTGQTTLDKILATITSMAALAKGAGYVPTTVQPQQQTYSQYPQQYDTATLQMLANQQALNTQNNLGGKITEWITTNSGFVAIGAVVLGAYLIQSPRKK